MFLSYEFPWPAGLCKHYRPDDQLVSAALLEIKLHSTDANELLLICSSTTRFKTFLTSMTTCTSHHYENRAWTPP